MLKVHQRYRQTDDLRKQYCALYYMHRAVINCDGARWVLLLAAYRRIHSPSRLAWSEGRQPLGAVPHLSNEQGELSQWL